MSIYNLNCLSMSPHFLSWRVNPSCLFVTLAPSTKPMQTEVASAGFYTSPHHGNFPKIQILTVEGLLSGAEAPKYIDLSQGGLSFKKAKQEKQIGEQQSLF
jgi:hypothetical protein